jgi:nucleotide-binding universal stress UspA family protein
MLSIHRILLPTDFSQPAADAERRARGLAALFEAELHVLHVTRSKELEELPRRFQHEDPEARNRLAEHVSGWLGLPTDTGPKAAGIAGSGPAGALGDLARSASPRGSPGTSSGTDDRSATVVRSIRRSGSPQDGILDYADEIDADLIVIGTRGQGAARGPLLGTVADRIVRRAASPVVTVRPDLETADPGASEIEDGPRSERTIVVPVDFSEPTETLITHAKHFAETFAGRVDFIHVVEEPRFPSFYQIDRFRADVPQLASRAREELVTAVREAGGPDVDAATHVLTGGDPASEIVRYAEAQSARFILMTTHGAAPSIADLRTALLGGVTDRVLRTAPCPVGAMKSYGKTLIPDGEE